MPPGSLDTVELPDSALEAPDTEVDAPGSPGGPAPLEPGDRAGDYEIESQLAQGGFGAIYRARGVGGAVALKVLRPELATTEQTIARFEREVDAVARIDHPSVVQVFGRGRTVDGRPYFAMELLRGRDLAAHIRARGALPWADALALMAPICDALGAAHDRGIIHRDIKASNVFLAGDRVILLDFGVAKVLDPAVPGLTRSRQIVGTPPCMAPEQLAGRPVDRRTDVYGVGALAYHMLTGRPPFADESPVMLQHLHRHARRPRPSAVVAVPAEVDRAVVSAMAVRPDARPSNARELMVAFERARDERRPRSAIPGRAIAVHVDAMPARAGAVSAADFDAVDRVLVGAQRRLEAEGFRPAVAASRMLLYARPAAGGGVDDAERLARELRETAPDRVRVTVDVREGDALVAGGATIAGEVLALSRDAAEAPP